MYGRWKAHCTDPIPILFLALRDDHMQTGDLGKTQQGLRTHQRTGRHWEVVEYAFKGKYLAYYEEISVFFFIWIIINEFLSKSL